MAKRTAFINTKQEIAEVYPNKFFSDTFNRMVGHIEKLKELERNYVKGSNPKYDYYIEKGYEYIFLTYNKNNGKFIYLSTTEIYSGNLIKMI